MDTSWHSSRLKVKAEQLNPIKTRMRILFYLYHVTTPGLIGSLPFLHLAQEAFAGGASTSRNAIIMRPSKIAQYNYRDKSCIAVDKLAIRYHDMGG